MPTYRFTHPQTGEEITFTADRELTEEEVVEAARIAGGIKKPSFTDKVKGYNNIITAGFQKGILRGLGHIQGFNRPREAMTDDEYAQQQGYFEAADEIDKESRKASLGAEIDPDSTGSKVAEAFGNFVPTIAAFYTTGPAGGIPVLTAQAAGSWQAENLERAKKKAKEESPDIDDQEAFKRAIELTRTRAEVQGLKTAAITYAGGKLASRWGLSGVETGMKAGAGSGAIRTVVGSGLLEGVEEAADSLASNTIDWGSGWNDDITLKDAKDQAVESFVVGAILGGLIETKRLSLQKLSEDSAEGQREREKLGNLLSEAERNEKFVKRVKEATKGIDKIASENATKWAKGAKELQDAKEETLLNFKISEINKQRALTDLDNQIAEAEKLALDPTLSRGEREFAERRVEDLKLDRKDIENGNRDVLDYENQKILDSLGVKTAKEAYDLIVSGAEAESQTAKEPVGIESQLAEQAAEPAAVEPPVEREAPIESKEMDADVLKKKPFSGREKLLNKGQAAKRRSATAALGLTEADPKNPIEAAGLTPDVSRPDDRDMTADLGEVETGANLTPSEARALKKKREGKGFLMSGAELKKADDAERKLSGAGRKPAVSYTGREQEVEVIIDESVEEADLVGGEPRQIVNRAISNAESKARELGVKLTNQHKASIARKIAQRAEGQIPEAGSATVQDGLNALIKSIESRLEKNRKNSGITFYGGVNALGGVAKSSANVALEVAKKGLKSGLSLADAADIAMHSFGKRVKSSRAKITLEDKQRAEFAILNDVADFVREGGLSSTERDFFSSNFRRVKYAQKKLKPHLDAYNKDNKNKITLKEFSPKDDYSDVRTYMSGHPLGDISQLMPKGIREATAVLRVVKQSDTEATIPDDNDHLESILGKGEDKKKIAKEWNSPSRKKEQGVTQAVRLNVPSLTNHNIGVNVFYDNEKSGKVRGYASVASTIVEEEGGGVLIRPQDVARINFKKNEEGVPQKFPMAVFYGSRNEVEIAEGRKAVREVSEGGRDISLEELHDTDKWAQVGLNPRRAGHAYDRDTGLPVVGFKKGTKLVHLGTTVFAEGGRSSLKFGKPSDFINVPLLKLLQLRESLKKRIKINGEKITFSFMGTGPMADVMLRAADASLGLAIDAIIVGRKTVDQAVQIAYDSVVSSTKNMAIRGDRFSEPDFKNILKTKLAIAIDALSRGESEKQAILNAIKFTNPVTVADVEETQDLQKVNDIENNEEFMQAAEAQEADGVSGFTADDISMPNSIKWLEAIPVIGDVLSSTYRKLQGNSYLAYSFGLRGLHNAEKEYEKLKKFYRKRYFKQFRDLMTVTEKKKNAFSEETNSEIDSYFTQLQNYTDGKGVEPDITLLSERSQEIVRIMREVWDTQTADASALNIMQQGADGKWVKGKFDLGKLGEGGYYQIMYKKTLEALRKLADKKYSELNASEQLVIDSFLVDMGRTGETSWAELYAREHFSREMESKVLYTGSVDRANVEQKRKVMLPVSQVDLGVNAFLSQSGALSKRFSQIQSFGQKTTESKDLFDKYEEAIGDAKGSAARHALAAIRDARVSIYGHKVSPRAKGALGAIEAGSGYIASAVMTSGASLVTQLSSILNPVIRAKVLAGGVNSSFFKIMASMANLFDSKNRLSWAEAEALDLSGDMARAMVGDTSTELGKAMSALRAASSAAFDLTAGAGDRVTRVFAGNVGYAILRVARKEIEMGLDGETAKGLRRFAESYNIDFDALIAGDQDQVDNYIVSYVDETQFSYGEADVSYASRHPMAKPFLRFYDFMSQAQDFYMKMLKESHKTGGPSGTATTLLMIGASGVMSQEAISQLLEALGIRDDDRESIDEIASKEGVIDKTLGVAERALFDLHQAGLFGFVGYAYSSWQYKNGDYSLGDASPLSQAVVKMGRIATDKSMPPSEKVNRIAREFNFARKPIEEAMAVAGKMGYDIDLEIPATISDSKTKHNLFRKRKIMNILKRFADEKGIEVGGGGTPSNVKYYADQVADSLYSGNVAEAKQRAIEFSEKTDNKSESWTRLTSMIKNKQPLNLGASLNKAEKEAFRQWAEVSLSEADRRLVFGTSDLYLQTALIAGLITIEGENPDMKNLRSMKYQMTGVKPKRPAAVPIKRRSISVPAMKRMTGVE